MWGGTSERLSGTAFCHCVCDWVPVYTDLHTFHRLVCVLLGPGASQLAILLFLCRSFIVSFLFSHQLASVSLKTSSVSSVLWFLIVLRARGLYFRCSQCGCVSMWMFSESVLFYRSFYLSVCLSVCCVFIILLLVCLILHNVLCIVLSFWCSI